MRTVLLGAAALLVATAGQAAHRPESGEAELTKALQGYVAGPPQSCLRPADVDGSYIISNTAIVYRGIGGRLWVNRTKTPENLREDDIPVQIMYGGQMCRLDRVKLIERGSRIEHWITVLDDFTPYKKLPKK
jgi:hypothetical protein